jgi:hypothetical protein
MNGALSSHQWPTKTIAHRPFSPIGDVRYWQMRTFHRGHLGRDPKRTFALLWSRCKNQDFRIFRLDDKNLCNVHTCFGIINEEWDALCRPIPQLVPFTT